MNDAAFVIFNESKEEREHLICHMKVKNRKWYYIIFSDDNSIWMDIKNLPSSAFFCACHDRASMFRAAVGKKTEIRTFLPMNWLINEWGADKVKYIKPLQSINESITKKIPSLKKAAVGTYV